MWVGKGSPIKEKVKNRHMRLNYLQWRLMTSEVVTRRTWFEAWSGETQTVMATSFSLLIYSCGKTRGIQFNQGHSSWWSLMAWRELWVPTVLLDWKFIVALAPLWDVNIYSLYYCANRTYQSFSYAKIYPWNIFWSALIIHAWQFLW